jgi:hypothetical protein
MPHDDLTSILEEHRAAAAEITPPSLRQFILLINPILPRRRQSSRSRPSRGASAAGCCRSCRTPQKKHEVITNRALNTIETARFAVVSERYEKEGNVRIHAPTFQGATYRKLRLSGWCRTGRCRRNSCGVETKGKVYLARSYGTLQESACVVHNKRRKN